MQLTGEGKVKFVFFTAGKIRLSPSSPSSVPPSNARRYGELPPLGEALRAAEGVGPYDVDGTFSVPGTPSLSS